MQLLQRFKDYIDLFHLFQPQDGLLLAVSGGIDSTVMCELCKQAGYDFSIAHCNFQLRGEESERDELFVRSLADKYGVEVLVKKFETEKYASEKKISIQVAARELRYAWFEEVAETRNAKPPSERVIRAGETRNLILTAHHLDDNIETVLMNFFKGTGIAGLRGILPKKGWIARPLLFARKEELLQFAREYDLKWMEDSSNESDKYSRNYLRHHLIPVIEKIYPQALENIAGNIGRFRDIELLYDESWRRHINKLIETKGEEVHVPVLALKKLEPVRAILFELTRKYGFTPRQVEEILHLLESESGKYILSASHRILKNRNWLIISPIEPEHQQHIIIGETDVDVRFPGGSIHLKSVSALHLSGKGSPINTMAQIDADEVNFPLLLRRWRAGDYFYPLGMRKKKKLARFFIDQKLSLAEKEKIWVLEMNKKIIWVIGLRIDDRVKLTERSKKVLEITFHQKV